MIISHKYKFIFIKTKKTAGSSIQSTIEKHCGKEDIITPMGQLSNRKYKARNYNKVNNGLANFGTHDKISYVKDNIPKDIWDSYLKVTAERNPWDKTVSMYHYTKKYQNVNMSFDGWVHNKNMNKEKWLPKCWDYYHIDDECVVDFFIMYENLENDYQKFCDMVGVPYEVLNKEKFLRKDKKYHQYYDDTTKNIVSDNFINEINKFHYKF